MKKIGLSAILLILVLTAVSCNMPIRQQPTQEVSPLELSVTALFATAQAQPPSSTPQPEVATSTQEPPTSEPSATLTLVPPTAVPPTATSSKTPRPPTAAPTQPGARGGVSVSAAFMDPAPTIDGDWAEWKNVAHEYPANNVVFGKNKWTGEDDLSSSYYVGWDSKYLYIAVKVHDDKYVQNATGANIYKGDSIEVLVDNNVKGDFFVDSLTSDDYQIGISPGRPTIGDGNREAYRWYPSSKAGSLSGVVIGAVYEGAIYRVEAAIPWSNLGVTPVKGMHLGFAISVSDDDTPGSQAQESMVSNVPNRHLTDPTTWGDLVLK